MKIKNNKSNKKIGLIIKIIILLSSLVFLYKQLFVSQNINKIEDFVLVNINNFNSYIYLSIALFLVFINIGIESYKWKFMIRKIEYFSFIRAFGAIVTGITVSVSTPNRIGEFGGRIFHLEKADRVKGALITLLGSFSKFITTVFLGSLGLLSLPFFINSDYFRFDSYLYYILVFIVILLNSFLFIVFLNSPLISKIPIKYLQKRKLQKYLNTFTIFNTNELLKILSLSLSRSMVFSIQYLLLLYCTGVYIDIIPGLLMISIVFFVNSVVPSIAWTEIFVRSSVAGFFIGNISDNEIGIAGATLFIWFVNIVIPSIIGLFFIFKLKFFRK